MNMTTCLETTTLQSLLDQSLPGRETQHCEAHLEICPACRRRLETLAGEPPWWQETVAILTEAGAGLATGNFPSDTAGDWMPAADVDVKTVMLSQIRQLLEAPAHPEMLGRLAGYDIESLLGQGGFGVVFRAFDRELNRPVAIKVLAPHLATVGTARRRFVREAQAAAAVSHPNVVPIYAVYSDAPYPFLVMSYVPGRSVQEQVRQAGPLEPKTVVRIGQQVAAGLAAAHRQGLVHRDIKPANILLENGLDRALITDFGLARTTDDAVSQTGWLAGTPHYMSPEQAASGELDGRSDLFSLGSVLYFMATGREPFRGTQPLAIMNQIANQKPPSVRSVNSDTPQVLAQVIERLLEKKPADRFQSADELSDFLQQYLAHLHQPELRIQPRVPRKPRTACARSRLWFGGAMALMSTAALYGWSVRSVIPPPSSADTVPHTNGKPTSELPNPTAMIPAPAATSETTPVTALDAVIPSTLADWDTEETDLVRNLERLRDDMAATEQRWRKDRESLHLNDGTRSGGPDLSEQFQNLRQAIRHLESGTMPENVD
jgi:serine/threonine-protein kinase